MPDDRLRTGVSQFENSIPGRVRREGQQPKTIGEGGNEVKSGTPPLWTRWSGSIK